MGQSLSGNVQGRDDHHDFFARSTACNTATYSYKHSTVD